MDQLCQSLIGEKLINIQISDQTLYSNSVLNFLCQIQFRSSFHIFPTTPTAIFPYLMFGYFYPWFRNISYLRSEEHTSELQSRGHLVCRLLLEKKQNNSIH